MLPQEVVDRVRSYIQHQGAKSPAALAELVEAGQVKLLAALGDVDERRASTKPAPDEWSLRELMLHVVSAESGLTSMLGQLSAGTMDAAGVTKERSQRMIGMSREDDGATFAALLGELRQLNERTLAAVRAIPETADRSAKPHHPFFGPLDVFEWAAFQRVHDEDHAQHAQKILDATK
ncbi:MAG: DinB family protein [Dehalococcoidia bacterium]